MKKLLTLTCIVALSHSSQAAITNLELGLSRADSGSRSFTNLGSLINTGETTSDGGNPQSSVYQISGLTLDSVGTADDSITLTLTLTGTGSAAIAGHGASFSYWGVNDGSGSASLVDEDESLAFAIGPISVNLGAGAVETAQATFLGFKGFGALNVATGETFDITGTTNNNATNVDAKGLPNDTSDTNVELYNFSGYEQGFTIAANSGAMRYGRVLTDIRIETTAIPEPSSCALLSLAGLTLLRRKR
ncbi:PEP-CTERM sorting domain-containing protein [Rubritalea tangerina]|uniref:PEP-CTERM sorting domain-containing protein n=1 Tax=Rubritalea tangerina TaxID=430798 RepID=A0ABW4ZBJ6_9BACT